jgi:thiopeptide-type bacteriocin biosynthesis protein
MSAVFRAAGSALLRAAAHTEREVASPPDHVHGPTAAVDWLRKVWTSADLAEAIEHSSPDLAREVHTLTNGDPAEARRVRHAVAATHRYVLRAGGRATPFGLLAGVAPAVFGTAPAVHWGTDHHVRARVAARWLDEMIERLHAVPNLLARLPVVVNDVVRVRSDILIVPAIPQRDPQRVVDSDLRVGLSRPIQLVLDLARSPIPMTELAARVSAEFPRTTPDPIERLLRGLVANHVLLTSLAAPSTCTDPLRHLLAQLHSVNAHAVPEVADVVGALHEIHDQLTAHNNAFGCNVRNVRDIAAKWMRHVHPTSHHPLALDLRLDAAATLPAAVAREVERAATILLRLSAAPTGLSAWNGYHMRFYERYGRGALVPLLQVVDPDSGIGWPDGYPGADTDAAPTTIDRRDEALLALAQSAALTGQHEVSLDEAMVAALSIGPSSLRTPAHVELAVGVHAPDVAALQRGRFRVQVLAVARSAGPMVGRFLDVLDDAHSRRLRDDLAAMPSGDLGSISAQLSFPPVSPADGHVARAAKILSLVISLGEHYRSGPDVLTVDDLFVGCDGRRMYLAAPALGKRIEAVVMHGLNPVQHTPPLARFLIELTRAQYAQTTAFTWGAAAAMPFRPRLRYGRIILAPATWRVTDADLASAHVPQAEWDATWQTWQRQRRIPDRVLLSHGDQRLPLNLADATHRHLLRDNVTKHGRAELVEAPPIDANGWLGGHAHELIVPLAATAATAWPKLPAPDPARVIGRGHGLTPATSRLLLAELYGDRATQDRILTRHLPDLLHQLGQRWNDGLPWWFVRFRNPDQHLRLRLDLPTADDFGPAAAIVSAWADRLHHAGLLRDIRYATSYPETGRWGSGPALAAVEDVFRADSAAVLAQLQQPQTPTRLALMAAAAVSAAAGFCGGTAAGMAWLIDNIPATPDTPVDRAVFAEAVSVADPNNGWAALRAAPGGSAIVEAWQRRDAALAAYRNHLPGPHTIGVDIDDVLASLLHLGHARANRIDFADEAVVFYLARAAAKRWTACRGLS